ncbi:hypothetical protein FRB99_001812, partial [Tulasnella sp. 403]
TDILPLYQALPKQTLAVTACVVGAVYGTQLSRFLAKVGSEEGVQGEWEDVLDMGVVEGLLTYMQSKSCDREAIAKTLYPVVCPILYQGSSDKLGVILRRQVCSLLTDSATNHKANKALLVDTAVLGATRLGEVLARTNDYLLIDGLLELVALLAPRRTADRKDFAEEVFFNPTAVERFGPGGARRLVVILAEAGGDWLKTSLELNRYMGIANIEKPQIFPMENLVIMGQPILQMDKDRHVCIDRRAVFSAIPDSENENAIDTLEIPINTLHQIRISEVVGNKVNIQVSLVMTEPPLLASTPMDGPKDKSAGGMFVAKFEVKKDSGERLREVIRARSLSDKCRDNTLLQPPERKAQRNATSSQPLYLPQPEPKYASPSTGERRRRISSHDLEGPVQVEVVPPNLARSVITKTGKAVPSEKKSSNTTATKIDPIPVDELSDLSDAPEEFNQPPPPPGRLSKSTKRTRVDSPLSSPSTVKSVKPSPGSLTKPKTALEDLKAKPKRKRVDDEDEVQLVEEVLRPKRARKSEEKGIQPSSPVPKSTKVGAKQGQGKSMASRALAHKSGAGAKPRPLESAKTRPKPRMLGKKTADDAVGKVRPVEKGARKPASVTASDTEEVIVISEEEQPLTSVVRPQPKALRQEVKATPISIKPAKSKKAPWLVDSEKEQPSSETGIKLGVLPSDEADPLSDPFITPVSGEQGEKAGGEDEFGLDPVTPVLEGLDSQRRREGKGGEGGLGSGTHGGENKKLNAGAIEPESWKRTSPTRATTDVLPTIEENVDENDEDHLEPADDDDIGDITLTNALDGTVGRNTGSKEVDHELETPSRKVVTFAANVTEHPVLVGPKIKGLKPKGVVSAKEVKVKPAQTEPSTRELLQLDVPKRTKPKPSTVTAGKKYEAKQQALKDPVNELLDEMDQPVETEDECKAIIKVLDAVRT